MKVEEGKKQLIEWLDDLAFCREPKMYEEIQSEENRIWTRIYTNDYCYSISATFDTDEGYLGCISTCRKNRPGESHTRGSDLPDGKFSLGTWRSILRGIVRNELVGIFDSPEPILDDV